MDQMSEKNSPVADIANALRGVLMGAADIVPGVSGGTVALLLGIYPRLLTAISHVDGQLWRLIREAKWGQASRHLDLRFLVTLALGVGISIVLLADLLHYLLNDHTELTMSVFFGLILASSILVLRMVGPKTSQQVILFVGMACLGACVAAGLVLLGVLKPSNSLAYTFMSGAIAICAMILPGVSGSYLLVMLGKYEEILDIIHVLKGTVLSWLLPILGIEYTADGIATWSSFLTLCIFACGCVTGLLLFSKLLKLLLAKFYVATMSLLGGFMLGSLVKVWPWQERVDGLSEKVTKPIWPSISDPQVIYCLILALAAFALVLIADYFAQNKATPHEGEA